jgi:trimethylamine--corrinoid protein Co-methyltransferase
MPRQGLTRNLKILDVLSQSQVEQIHLGTLEVLQRTGVKFHDEKALDILAQHGCQVDAANKLVRIPEKLVMDCLSKCPDSFIVKAREPENSCQMTSGKTSYIAPSPNLKSVDLDTWEPKEPTREEFYNYVRVIDSLPNADLQTCFPFFGFTKVPQYMRILESNAAKLRVSTKAQWEGTLGDNYKWNIEMARVTDQDIMQLANPTAPLTFFKETIDHVYYYTEKKVPFSFCSGPMLGASGPATIAGSLVVNNADALAGIIFAQLLSPGSRVWVGSMLMSLDMKTCVPIFGDVGNFLCDAAFNQMWRHYKIPCFGTASAWSSSKTIDYQAGYEMAMALLIEALSGASCMTFFGGITAELVGHPVKAILDDDIAGIVKRFLLGVDVSEETMALDLIHQIGPVPGNFLGEEHTRDWWRKETYIPRVADRSNLNVWLQTGKNKAIDYARQRMEEILQTHKIKLLPANQENAIEDILNEARRYYRERGLISDDEWKIYQGDIHSPNYPYA